MWNQRRRSGSRAARLLWGGLALVVLGLLGLSFLLAGGALESAEADAELRAERETTSVLLNLVSPELASGDIVGTEYRTLLEVVQARILDDDRIARVRVWKPDGNLIFSTAPRDVLGEVVAPDDPQIEQAADGVTVSLVVESRGANGTLFRTFVPLRASDGLAPHAVAEIAQRYGDIQAASNRTWRPVQIGLAILLGALLVVFGLSFRGGRAAHPVGSARPTRDERKLRDAEERARAAERAARQAEERLADAERRLKDASTKVPPEVLAKVDGLEMKLKAEAVEREHVVGEAQRLRSALTAKEAELALAKEGAAATAAEMKRWAELLAKANERANEAEKRAGEVELRAADATQRVASSEARMTELEAALRHAEERAARAEAEVDAAKRDDESRAAVERRTSQLEADALRLKLAEAEASLADARTKLAEREHAMSETGGARAEVDEARAELDVAKADLVRARLELDAMKAELEEARAHASVTTAELDEARARANATTVELSEARAHASAATAAAGSNGDEAAARVAELEARLAEIEAERRDEIAQLQKAHESLANTQAELMMQSNRKLREAQDPAHEVEQDAGVGPAHRTARRSERAAASEQEADAAVRTAPPSSLPDEVAPYVAPESEPAPPPREEEPAEPLSLRERLARAAAARHRTGTPSG